VGILLGIIIGPLFGGGVGLLVGGVKYLAIIGLILGVVYGCKKGQWVFLRLIFKWPLLGFLFNKNKNLMDILDFKLLGFMAKQSKLTIYVTLVLLYLIYVIISIYVIHEFKNNSNKCYILRNMLMRNSYPKKKQYQDLIHKDVVKYHTIYYNNIFMLIILIILYGFNSDIFVNFANLFISNTHYIETITKKITNTKCV